MVVILKTDTNIGTMVHIPLLKPHTLHVHENCCKYVYTNACVCVIDNAIQHTQLEIDGKFITLLIIGSIKWGFLLTY